MLWEPYILQSKRHALDNCTDRLNQVSIFDQEERLPEEGRRVEKNSHCSKKAMMDLIGIPHIL